MAVVWLVVACAVLCYAAPVQGAPQLKLNGRQLSEATCHSNDHRRLLQADTQQEDSRLLAECSFTMFEGADFSGYTHTAFPKLNISQTTTICQSISSALQDNYRLKTDGSVLYYKTEPVPLDNLFAAFHVSCNCSSSRCYDVMENWQIMFGQHPIWYKDGGKTVNFGFLPDDCSESTCELRGSLNNTIMTEVVEEGSLVDTSSIWACPAEIDEVCAGNAGFSADAPDPTVYIFSDAPPAGPLGLGYSATNPHGCCIQSMYYANLEAQSYSFSAQDATSHWQFDNITSTCYYSYTWPETVSVPQEPDNGTETFSCDVRVIPKNYEDDNVYLYRADWGAYGSTTTCQPLSRSVAQPFLQAHDGAVFAGAEKVIFSCDCSNSGQDCFQQYTNASLHIWPQEDFQGDPQVLSFTPDECDAFPASCFKAVITGFNSSDILAASLSMCWTAPGEDSSLVKEESTVELFDLVNFQGANLTYAFTWPQEQHHATCEPLSRDLSQESFAAAVTSVRWTHTCSGKGCVNKLPAANVTLWEKVDFSGDKFVLYLNQSVGSCKGGGVNMFDCSIAVGQLEDGWNNKAMSASICWDSDKAITLGEETKVNNGEGSSSGSNVASGSNVVKIVVPIVIVTLVLLVAAVLAAMWMRRKRRRAVRLPPTQNQPKTTIEAKAFLDGVKGSSGPPGPPLQSAADASALPLPPVHASRPPLDSVYLNSLLTSSSTASGSGDSGDTSSYSIDPMELQLCLTEDGSPMKLGEGGFSVVYRGVCRGRDVAVKVLNDNPKQADSIRNLLREIAHSRRCRHPNIVTFVGASFSGANVLLCYELMEGGQLFDLLRSERKEEFSWYRRGQHIALDIAKGLTYLHTNKIIHVDIKSLNMLLTAAGDAKIGDMGMSKYQANTYVTKEGQIGSWTWAAPELILNSHIDEKVDIYSFGVVLWEIITGLPPVRGEMREPSVPEECPQEIAALFHECTATSPQQRPSAAQILDRISVVLPQEGNYKI